MFDKTTHVYGMFHKRLAKYGVGGENARYVGFDLETYLGTLKGSADIVGKQADAHLMYLSQIDTLAHETLTYGKFSAKVKPTLIQGKVAQYSILGVTPASVKQKFAAAGFGAEDFTRYEEEVLRLLYTKQGGTYSRAAALAMRSRTRATMQPIAPGDVVSAMGLGGKEAFPVYAIGHNIEQFDKAMIRGIGGIGANVKFIDTLHLSREMFAEMGIGGGKHKLENIRAAMEYLYAVKHGGAIKDVSKAVLNAHMVESVADLKYGSVRKYYGSVLDKADDLLAGYEWARDYYGVSITGAAAHRFPMSDLAISNALFRASLIRSERGGVAERVFKNYLKRVGVVGGETLEQASLLLRRTDPAGILGAIPSRRGMKVYRGVESFEGLFTFMGQQHGRGMEMNLRKMFTGKMGLHARLADPTFILKETAGGWTNLVFGDAADATTYTALPVMKQGPFGRGILYEGTNIRSASAIGHVTRGGKVIPLSFTDLFYNAGRKILQAGKFLVTSANADRAIRDFIRQVGRTPIRRAGTATLAMKEGREITMKEATVASLRGQTILHQGRMGFGEEATRGAYMHLVGESGISTGKANLSAAISLRNKAAGAGNIEAFNRALAMEMDAYVQMTDAMNLDPRLMKAFLMGKPDALSHQGALMKIMDPEVVDIYGPAVQRSAIWKGRGGTAFRDFTKRQLDMFRRGGRFVGPSIISHGQTNALFRSSVEAGMLYVRSANAGIERMIFGDAGLLGSPSGFKMFTDNMFQGTIKIKNAPNVMAELSTIFGTNLEARKFEALGEADWLNIRGLKGSAEKRTAFNRLRSLTKDEHGKRVWDMLATGRASVASFKVGDELALQIYTSSAQIPRFENFLVGAGRTRVMAFEEISGQVANRLSRAIGFTVDFIAPMDMLKSSNAAMETLLSHRITLARRYGLLDDMLSFFNKTPGISSGGKVFSLVDSNMGMKSLQLPAGVDKEAVFNYLGHWYKNLEQQTSQWLTYSRRDRATKLTHHQRNILAYREGYSGISLTGRALRKFARSQGVSARALRGSKFFFDEISVRTTTADVAKSMLEGVSFTQQNIRTMMQGPMGTQHPIFMMLNKEMRGGFAGGRLQLTPKMQEFFSSFAYPSNQLDPSKTILLQLRDSRYHVIQKPKGARGIPDILELPGITYNEFMETERLAGTVLDPDLLRKYNLHLVFDTPHTIATETVSDTGKVLSRKTMKLTHLPIAPVGALDIGGKVFKYAPGDIAGAYTSFLSNYANLGGDLSALTAGVTDAGVPITVGGKLTTLFATLMGRTGKHGFLDKSYKLKGLPGFRARPSHLSTRLLRDMGQPSLMQLAINNQAKTADLSSIFDIYMSENEALHWARQRYGRGKAYKRIKTMVDTQDYFHVFLRADPMQTMEGHAAIARLRITSKMNRRASSNTLSLAVDSFLVWHLDRDLDMDAITVLMAERLKGYGTKGMDRAAMERTIQEQVRLLRADYFGWIKGLKETNVDEFSGFVRAVEAGILDVMDTGFDIMKKINPLDLQRRGAAKMMPSLAFTTLRESRVILGGSAAVGVDEYTRRLIKSGMGQVKAYELAKAVAPLHVKRDGRSLASAAQNLIRVYHQAGIKKGGAYVKEVLASTRGLISVMHAASEFDKTGYTLASAIQEATEAFGHLDFPASLAAGYEKQFGMKAPAILGQAFGTTLYSMWKGGKSAFRDVSMAIEKAASTNEITQLLKFLDKDEADKLLKTGALTDQAVIDLLTNAGSKSGPQVEKGLIAGIERATRRVSTFARSDAGKIVGISALAIGAYSIVQGALGQDEIAPTAQGSPLPPPPRLEQPDDYGPRVLPQMASVSARIAPSHPASSPRGSLTRDYSSPISAVDVVANRMNVRFQDETDPISRYEIKRRMDEIARSSFTS